MTDQTLSSKRAERRHPWWRSTLLVLVFSLAAGIVGYAGGLAEQNRRLVMVETSNQALLNEVATLRDQHQQLRLQLASQQGNHRVDIEALREARSTIVALKTELAELTSDLGFYRSIMAPSEMERGFQLDSFQLSPADGEGVFDYDLVVIQVGNNERFRSGWIRLVIEGVRNDEPLTLELHEVSENADESGIRYRFRYFQDIEGRLVLPEGFQPESVQVVASARNRSQPLLDVTRAWSQLLAID